MQCKTGSPNQPNYVGHIVGALAQPLRALHGSQRPSCCNQREARPRQSSSTAADSHLNRTGQQGASVRPHDGSAETFVQLRGGLAHSDSLTDCTSSGDDLEFLLGY